MLKRDQFITWNLLDSLRISLIISVSLNNFTSNLRKKENVKFTVDSQPVNSTHEILEPRNGVVLQDYKTQDYALEPKKNSWYNLVV